MHFSHTSPSSVLVIHSPTLNGVPHLTQLNVSEAFIIPPSPPAALRPPAGGSGVPVIHTEARKLSSRERYVSFRHQPLACPACTQYGLRSLSAHTTKLIAARLAGRYPGNDGRFLFNSIPSCTLMLRVRDACTLHPCFPRRKRATNLRHPADDAKCRYCYITALCPSTEANVVGAIPQGRGVKLDSNVLVASTDLHRLS